MRQQHRCKPRRFWHLLVRTNLSTIVSLNLFLDTNSCHFSVCSNDLTTLGFFSSFESQGLKVITRDFYYTLRVFGFLFPITVCLIKNQRYKSVYYEFYYFLLSGVYHLRLSTHKRTYIWIFVPSSVPISVSSSVLWARSIELGPLKTNPVDQVSLEDVLLLQSTCDNHHLCLYTFCSWKQVYTGWEPDDPKTT